MCPLFEFLAHKEAYCALLVEIGSVVPEVPLNYNCLNLKRVWSSFHFTNSP